MDEGRRAYLTSVVAVGISGISLLFTGLQWYEAHRERLSQAEANLRSEEEQRRSRQLAEAQIMAADRANILAQRQANPSLGKNDADMPALVSYPYDSLLLKSFLPLIGSGRSTPSPSPEDDPVRIFLESKAKTVTLANHGKTTAYSVTASNLGTFDDPDRLQFMRSMIAESGEPVMLAPDASIEIVTTNESAQPKAADLFRRGEASYYMIGRVEYRDAFQRLKNGVWCYEYHVKHHVSGPEIEQRICDPKTDSSGMFRRIEYNSKD